MDYITTSKCHQCGSYTSCAALSEGGNTTMHVCKHCEPRIYESVATEQKERWLRGGKVQHKRQHPGRYAGNS